MNRIYLTPDGAEHLASLLALEARKCLFSVVRTLEAENEGEMKALESENGDRDA